MEDEPTPWDDEAPRTAERKRRVERVASLVLAGMLASPNTDAEEVPDLPALALNVAEELVSRVDISYPDTEEESDDG